MAVKDTQSKRGKQNTNADNMVALLKAQGHGEQIESLMSKAINEPETAREYKLQNDLILAYAKSGNFGVEIEEFKDTSTDELATMLGLKGMMRHRSYQNIMAFMRHMTRCDLNRAGTEADKKKSVN